MVQHNLEGKFAFDTRTVANAERTSGVACRIPERELLDDVVRELREIERQTGIEKTLSIGSLVLSRFFGGNAELWRDRRRNKNNSIRRLAERDDCPFRKSALNDAVAIYVAVEKLPCVRLLGHIGATHVAAVLGLKPEEQEQLLREADEQRWSVRELKQRVVAQRRSEGEKRGRPAVTGLEHALRLLCRAVRNLGPAVAQVSRSTPESDVARATATVKDVRSLLLAHVESFDRWLSDAPPSSRRLRCVLSKAGDRVVSE
jgi:hypothetical protein